MSKPEGTHDSKWYFWRVDYPTKRRLNKFTKWDKMTMNRRRRRVARMKIKEKEEEHE
jgi:hypothetical protein